jgi:hypothetical protein
MLLVIESRYLLLAGLEGLVGVCPLPVVVLSRRIRYRVAKLRQGEHQVVVLHQLYYCLDLLKEIWKRCRGRLLKPAEGRSLSFQDLGL